ncbi:hypothetical protein CK503_04950 [Aliifodinibius salipaludis]|uniref:Uncharacterized protein n=1 Tax=Fodinibius salipaludis TaxID=2032627 RepID=A0A2A2GDH2_9BACT|nr:hypothetical protein [Aliifodinibius salipaludis]PAU94822.1 hypothetical protein CK503_04950 [Aliifodinibius salipaludis]
METEQSPSFNHLKEFNDQFDQQLQELDREPSGDTSSSWKKALLKILLGIIALVLPFFLLVRTSVFMYSNYQTNGWLALSIGCIATVILLLLYGGVFVYRFGMANKALTYIFRGVLVLVVAYTFYGMLFYSSLNTKTEEIRSYYRSLHPIMRVALTTVTLADSEIVVIDIQRRPEDYHRMGLSENEQSLHYIQPSGYVHAVDLRTKDKPNWKNSMFEYSFKILGLSTIRHVGTADHLHVYLPLNK